MSTRSRSAEPPAAATPIKFTNFEQLARRMLKTSAEFCEIDLFNDEAGRRSSSQCSKRQPAASTTRRVSRGDAKRRPRWVLFVRGVYLYTTARILLYIYLQYVYDFHSYEYEHLRGRNALQPTANSRYRTSHSTITRTSTITVSTSPINASSSSTDDHLPQLLEQRLKHDIWRLKLVGAPFIKFHFGSELIYVFLIWAGFVLYLRPQLYFRYIKPFDVGLLRAVIDWNRERLYCDQLVKREVNKFCLSKSFFVRSQLQRSTARHSSCIAAASQPGKPEPANLGRTTAEQLNCWALNGSLMPFNRSLVWIKRTSRQMGCFSIGVLIGHSILMVSLFIFLPQSQFLGMSGIETGPMDLLFIVETFIFGTIEVISVNFYLTVTVFNTLDQIRTINKLNSLIERCIRFNTKTFMRVQALCAGRFDSMFTLDNSTSLTTTTAKTHLELPENSTTGSQHVREATSITNNKKTTERTIDQCYAQMENNLLFVVMSYKIFISQSKPARSFTALTIFMTVELMLLAPVICLTYSAQYLTPGMLYIVFACCLSFIMWGDTSLAPCCYIHSCHLRTYRALHSLLAHTVALRCAAASPIDLYDSHSILTLRKELRQPDMLLNKSAVTLLGVRFTYTNFLRIHFWCGILAMVGYNAVGRNKRGIFERTRRFF